MRTPSLYYRGDDIPVWETHNSPDFAVAALNSNQVDATSPDKQEGR